MAIGTGAAILGGSLIGGAGALLASRGAADAQGDAAQRAAGVQREELAQQREFFEQGVELQRPGRQVGQQALNSLAVLFGLEPAVPSGVSNEQVIRAQVAREVPAEQAQQAQQQQQFAQTLDAVPQDVRAQYERLIDARIDLPGDNARQRPQFRAQLDSLRQQYPGLAELDQEFASQGRLHRDVPAAPQGQASGNPLAAAAQGQQFSGFSGPQGAGFRSSPNIVFAGGSPTFNEAAGSQQFDMQGNQTAGPTAGAPTTPIAGQETQLQRTGFLDEPNNPAATREGVLQSLRDFPVSRFLQEEGMRDIQGSAAARGSLSSGRTLQALSEFNQNLAQAQSIQPFIGGLQGLAGVGQTAATNTQQGAQAAAGASQAGANNLANLALQRGDARASAFQGANQAFQGTLGNLTTAALLAE